MQHSTVYILTKKTAFMPIRWSHSLISYTLSPMNTPDIPHPGAVLRSQFMANHGLSASGLAIRLHVPAPRVNDIVRERRGISPDTALRLARFFGTTPQYWMDLQTAYDLKVAQTLSGEQIRREIATASASANKNSTSTSVAASQQTDQPVALAD
jgi:addiction module HigA family antidote